MTAPTDPQAPWLSGKSIIIAGAGMAGLSFAISLAHLWPSNHPKPNITIFERDSYADRIGREGYTLSLRTDSRSGGIQVLDNLGLYEKTLSASVGSEGSMYFWSRTFDNPLLKVHTKPFGPKNLTGMRIRRNSLQRVLADAAISLGCKIHWGKAINEATLQPNNTYLVQISGGSSATCDLLIAADGSRSRIRSIIHPTYNLNFANIVAITGTAKFPSSSDIPPPLTKDWGMILGGGGTGCFVAPVDTTSALWSLTYVSKTPRPPLPPQPLSAQLFNEVCVEAHSLAKHLDSAIHTLIDHTDPSTLQTFNCMDRPPFPHNPRIDGPVVFLGDACHAVSPFAGNGANMALMDGWDLAVCLCSSTSASASVAGKEGEAPPLVAINNLETALHEYDKKSIPRSASTLKFSRWSIDIAHATGWKLWLYTLMTRVLRWFFVSGRDLAWLIE